MSGLETAWSWYLDTKKILQVVQRLGDRHWDDLPWDNPSLGKDEKLSILTGIDLKKKAEKALDRLDDIAVITLFGEFEAIVRDRVRREVETERARLEHVVLQNAATAAIKLVDKGSFSAVLDLFKRPGSDAAELVGDVKQIREYRNWVSHGRRGEAKNRIAPKMAFDRLSRFLESLETQS